MIQLSQWVALEGGPYASIAALLRQGQTAGVAPGLAAAVWERSHPEQVWLGHAGQRRLEPSPAQPLETDSTFDLASLTKVISTVTLIAMLEARGWLDVRAPITSLLPDWTGSPAAKADVRVWHLLTHSAGFPAWLPLWERLESRARAMGTPLGKIAVEERRAWMRAEVRQTPIEAKPGERVLYSDPSFMTLGFLIEELTGQSLPEVFKSWIAEPWGLKSLRFRATDHEPTRLQDEHAAATERCAWRGAMLQGQVHDENCWAMGGAAGHAGLFGTLKDVMRFAVALQTGGLSPPQLNRFWTPITFPDGQRRTLGWDVPAASGSLLGSEFSRLSVGHWGFTGTSLWTDPERGLTAVLLTNRVHPTRDNLKIREFRPVFFDAVARAFDQSREE